jgi:hypothetical protein
MPKQITKAEKPLFIPVYKRYFLRFQGGEKRVEYRLYGKRWNEHTCRFGRSVVVSNGYGKSGRLTGRICGFAVREIVNEDIKFCILHRKYIRDSLRLPSSNPAVQIQKIALIFLDLDIAQTSLKIEVPEEKKVKKDYLYKGEINETEAYNE